VWKQFTVHLYTVHCMHVVQCLYALPYLHTMHFVHCFHTVQWLHTEPYQSRLHIVHCL